MPCLCLASFAISDSLCGEKFISSPSVVHKVTAVISFTSYVSSVWEKTQHSSPWLLQHLESKRGILAHGQDDSEINGNSVGKVI